MGHGKHMGSMKKMKSNQDGGSVTAKDPGAAANQLKKDQDSAGKHHGGMKHHGSMKMGYAQKLGSERMSPGKMGDEAAMKMMHGDAASKSYDGAGDMHMNGAPKYMGASKGYGVPKYMKGPANLGHPGDTPGHTHAQLIQTKLTGDGGGSTSTSTSSNQRSTSNLADYKSTLVDKGKDFKPTAQQTADANAEVARLTALDKKNAALNKESETKPATTNKQTTTTTDKESVSQIKAEGEVNLQNLRNKALYNRQQQNVVAARDSSAVAMDYLKKLPAHMQLTPKAEKVAGRKGGIAAYFSRKDSGLFSRGESAKMFKEGQEK